MSKPQRNARDSGHPVHGDAEMPSSYSSNYNSASSNVVNLIEMDQQAPVINLASLTRQNYQGLPSSAQLPRPPTVEVHQTAKTTTTLSSIVPRINEADVYYYENSKLGSGGYGQAHKVFHFLIGTAVLKIDHPHLKERISPQDYEKRKREFECIYQVNHHPNIVALYGYVYEKPDDSHPMGFLMEYMHGGTLINCIETRIPKSVDSKTDDTISPNVRRQFTRLFNTWAKQIGLGLAFIHSRNIIHRDIKPDNILMNKDINIAKISDFGLARTLDGGPLTQSVGTNRYNAPEVFMDSNYTQKADVWSYGMLLYYIYYHRQPFYDTPEFSKWSKYTAVRKIRGEDGDHPLRPRMIGLPIDDIMNTCLQTKEEDRCSMEDLIRALHCPDGVKEYPVCDA